ncbi:ATP-binding protein [Emticicia sp. SJ17W-69]|uniref:ATP-binding protein n=1 Tax=Emticicia sp. SJ17W-69 TaxID=3421657 RepID=UPI003EBA499F
MKTINLLLFLSLFGTLAIAQEKSYKQVRDYQISSNIDSLQKIVEHRKSKKENYLHLLINLEWSRYYYSNDFGKDVETIQTIALKKKDSLGQAMFYYLKALLNYYNNNKICFENGLKAHRYFEAHKDSLGMVVANHLIIGSAHYPQVSHENRKKSVFDRLEKTLKYYSHISDVRTKLLIINSMLQFGHYVDKSPKEQLVYFKTALKLLKNHSEYNYIKPSIFTGAANAYFRLKEGKKEDNYKKVQWCYLMAYQSSPSKPFKRTLSLLYNLGVGYSYIKEFKKAAFYYKKGIEIYNKLNINKPELIDSYYANLAAIQYDQKDYQKAYQSLEKEMRIRSILDSTRTVTQFQELQTKYETQQKELLIKKLELEKQSINKRAQIIITLLIITILIVLVVSFLAIKIRSTNKKLKELTQSRDKLFTIISHDLRSPLNSYQRYSEIVGYLVNTKQYARLKEVLKKIDVVGLNLASLLNNLLEWSIIQQKQIHLKPTLIQTTTFFSNILPIYRDMALIKHLNIKEEIQDITIKTDMHVLSLITRNLLDNAIKYTSEGKEIFIKAALEVNTFVLIISNQGDSMTESQIEKIDRLFNKGYSFDFGEEGIGTGLILIKEFAKTNDIKIVFDHTQENLTTFQVIIAT